MSTKLDNLRNISEALCGFGTHVLKHTPDETTVFSPHSLFTALSMTALGAKNDTLEQMLNTLGILDYITNISNKWKNFILQNQLVKSLSSYTVDLKNSNWIVFNDKIVLNPQFTKDLLTYFEADATLADFTNNSARETEKINRQVSKETNGLIDKLVPEGTITPDTLLALLNAIYFKAEWEKQFEKRGTRREDFNRLDGSTEKVDMMHLREAKNISAYVDDNVTVVDLPYNDSSLVFRIVFPNKEDANTFNSTVDKLPKYLQRLDSITTKLNLNMPKFKIESSLDANSILKKLGMVDAFSDKDADFTGMSDPNSHANSDIKIGTVIHKATFEVTEEGSEASAATAVMMVRKCIMPKESTLNITLNRPFYFAVQDRLTNTNLFIGKYLGS